ncbi:MAG: hypothetical protein EZS28_056614, partial [Streblomastix strix]
GPICTFNFQAEVSSQHVNNVFKVFKTIDSDLYPRLAKLTNVVTSDYVTANFVSTNSTQSITGSKTFNSNVSATGFVKTGKDDTSVLLAGGGDRLLSSFGGIEDLTSSAFSILDEEAVI